MRQEKLYFTLLDEKHIEREDNLFHSFSFSTEHNGVTVDKDVSCIQIHDKKGMYKENLLGKRTVINQSINGKLEANLYTTNIAPLTFSMMIGFDKPITNLVLARFSRFFHDDSYTRIYFLTREQAKEWHEKGSSFNYSHLSFYRVVFSSSPEIEYVNGIEENGIAKRQCFVHCNFICSSPSALREIQYNKTGDNTITISNPGNRTIYPTFSIDWSNRVSNENIKIKMTLERFYGTEQIPFESNSMSFELPQEYKYIKYDGENRRFLNYGFEFNPNSAWDLNELALTPDYDAGPAILTIESEGTNDYSDLKVDISYKVSVLE